MSSMSICISPYLKSIIVDVKVQEDREIGTPSVSFRLRNTIEWTFTNSVHTSKTNVDLLNYYEQVPEKTA